MTNPRNVLEAIGDTPLIRLNRASAATGCEIWGKAEFLNPGQSVKDRAALDMVAKALGYSCSIVIPRTQSQEKKDALRLYGAELIEVDAVPYANEMNYVKVSGRLAAELDETQPNGAVWANQFDNVANRQAHIETTGPEIWAQSGGKVDGFICSIGSGGTLAG